MTSEEEVYIWSKRLFRSEEWTLLASDPPRGTDVPRLEIKEPGAVQSLTKNKNAIINDLVYCKDGVLALVECKDARGKIAMDIEKLTRLKTDQAWRNSIASAMASRSLFDRDGVPTAREVRDGEAIVPVLSYPGTARDGLSTFVQITFDSGQERIRIGRALSSRTTHIFEKL